MGNRPSGCWPTGNKENKPKDGEAKGRASWFQTRYGHPGLLQEIPGSSEIHRELGRLFQTVPRHFPVPLDQVKDPQTIIEMGGGSTLGEGHLKATNGLIPPSGFEIEIR